MSQYENKIWGTFRFQPIIWAAQMACVIIMSDYELFSDKSEVKTGTISSKDLNSLFKTNSTSLLFSLKCCKRLLGFFFKQDYEECGKAKWNTDMGSNYCDWLA